jgi:glycosyltransferase involved in cell wall biosynthesis
VKVAFVGNGRSVHVLGRCAALARHVEARLFTLGTPWSEVEAGPALSVASQALPRTLPEALRAGRTFLTAIDAWRPDVLHVHYAGGRLGALALLAGWRPLVLTVMGGDVLPEQHPGGRMSYWARRTTRRLLARADAILAKADALHGPIAALGGDPRRVHTVRWGVDPGRFRECRAAADRLRGRLGLRPDDKVLLSPRVLAPLYNVELLVAAMPAVLARHPTSVLLVTEYGSDPGYRASLEALASGLELGDRVRFVGAWPGTEMAALYTLAEATLSVPSSDGLPQCLFESLACATPIVMGRLPIYSEVVTDGVHALLADLQPASIATATCRLLESPTLRARLVEAGRARVSRIAELPAEAERVASLYRGLSPARPPRPRWSPAALVDALGLALSR